MKVQLNSILFAKTLIRKDVASSSGSAPSAAAAAAAENDTATANGDTAVDGKAKGEDEEADFSSKAQIMTLMTTDVDRVSEFAWHLFTLIGLFFFLN